MFKMLDINECIFWCVCVCVCVGGGGGGGGGGGEGIASIMSLQLLINTV